MIERAPSSQNQPVRALKSKQHPVTTWAQFTLAAATVVGIISLFLPIGSAAAYGRSISVNYFSRQAGGEGLILLFLMLTLIGFTGVLILTHKNWARITVGIGGMLVGVIGMIDGFSTISNLSGSSGASFGVGAVLLGATETVLLLAALVTLQPSRPVLDYLS